MLGRRMLLKSPLPSSSLFARWKGFGSIHGRFLCDAPQSARKNVGHDGDGGNGGTRGAGPSNKGRPRRAGTSSFASASALAGCVAVGFLGVSYYYLWPSDDGDAHVAAPAVLRSVGDYAPTEVVPNLPTFTRGEVAELAEEANAEGAVVVTYRSGVFRIPKEFVDAHPGGARIKEGQGQALEHFWHEKEPIHVNSPLAQSQLRAYRVGNFADPVPESEVRPISPVSVEGRMLQGKNVFNMSPFNAEPRAPEFEFDDDQDDAFSRCHKEYAPVDAARYEVTVDGGRTVIAIEDYAASLELPRLRVRTSIQCMGNGRRFAIVDNDGNALGGSPWDHALFNGVFQGFPLRDILLREAPPGFLEEDLAVRFVSRGDGFSATVPLSHIPPSALVADTFNDMPLTHDHGGPWRVILPGFGGFANIKAVGDIEFIRLSTAPTKSDQGIENLPLVDQQVLAASPEMLSYVKRERLSLDNFGFRTPVMSRVTQVDRDEDGRILIQGYAHSGQGEAIAKVEVSLDGGASWEASDVLRADTEHGDIVNSHDKHLWRYRFGPSSPVTPAGEPLTVAVRATDSNGNIQPPVKVPNGRGLAHNRIVTYSIDLEELTVHPR